MLDGQAQNIRVFDSAGAYVETLGRRGEGPGELDGAQSLALLPDGRVVVPDPGNDRIQLYGPGRGETDEWEYDPGIVVYPSRPLLSDRRGMAYVYSPFLSPWGTLVDRIIVLSPKASARIRSSLPEASHLHPSRYGSPSASAASRTPYRPCRSPSRSRPDTTGP